MLTCKICTLDNKFCFKRCQTSSFIKSGRIESNATGATSQFGNLSIKLPELGFQSHDFAVKKFRCLACKGGTGTNVLIENHGDELIRHLRGDLRLLVFKTDRERDRLLAVERRAQRR